MPSRLGWRVEGTYTARRGKVPGDHSAATHRVGRGYSKDAGYFLLGGGCTVDRLTKSFPVFDCDAHINDPTQIWDYVPASKKDLVWNTYWRDEAAGWLNGDTAV